MIFHMKGFKRMLFEFQNLMMSLQVEDPVKPTAIVQDRDNIAAETKKKILLIKKPFIQGHKSISKYSELFLNNINHSN